MNILDNHVHTHFSSDGKDNMEDVIKMAIKMGVKYLTFTDHLEYNGEKFSLDLEKYVSTIYKYKEKYKKEILLLTGIEIGYQKHIKEDIENIISSYPFDFVLCSTHTVDKSHVSQLKFFENQKKEDSYWRYFESIMETTSKFKNYDSYGHLDYVIRYGGYKDNKVVYNDYKDVLDIALKNIINSGKGIELNTSGYRYGLDAIHPNKDILSRYKELGGEIITVGSDSHQSIDLCKDFDKAYDMLKYLDFKYVCIFKDRVANFISIEEHKKIYIA